MSKKRSNRVVRMPRLPVMKSLRDEFAMHMHTSLAVLRAAPSSDPYDTLAKIFNVVQVAIQGDASRAKDQLLINSGISAMNQIQKKVDANIRLKDHEIGPIQNAVNTIDQMLGKMDAIKLYQAIVTLNSMAKQ